MSSSLSKTVSRLTAHYAAIQIMINMIYLVVVSFSSVFLRSRGMNDLQIGLLMAVGTVLSIMTQPVLGSMADKVKNLRLGVAAGYVHLAMIPLAVILIATGSNLAATAAAFIVLRFLISATDPFENSMAMELINRGYPINFGLARGCGSAGYSAASFLIGKAVSGWGEELLMPCVIVMALAAAALMMVFRVPDGAPPAMPQQRKEEQETLDLLPFVRKNARFCIFILSLALIYYAQELRANYMYQIVLSIGGTAEEFGAATAFAALIEIPALVFFTRLMKCFKVRTLLIFSSVCLIVRTAVVCFGPTMEWIYLGSALQILSYGLFSPASIYYVNEVIGENNRNKGQTFLAASLGLSTVLSSVIGGGMLNASGGNPRSMLVYGILLSCVGVGIMIWVTRPKAKA